MVRLVLFQKNGAEQLEQFVSHHSFVLSQQSQTSKTSLESIVIIDHGSTENRTLALLDVYAKHYGIHVWKCDAPFDLKYLMWTNVIRLYSHISKFVFPLDVDELLAISKERIDVEQQSGAVSNDGELIWDRSNFFQELHSLDPFDGRAIKMETVTPIPPECTGASPW
eukprot:CAMPEP_0202450392 /NCGR_PEP_ID=MMETSP1360-20130828/9004_1 /ASSEMBLY_ACC=CAM_ASM_000848 /TAXON_ID=515479 /ORGANISM="Licmophora paradoxa, Strain CCMP2313" /LENGTH=166 /DNA_ID=CAMNT_0049068631 /DNA_START=170 /DNA_END=667 /DNA_ORIENTATION=+